MLLGETANGARKPEWGKEEGGQGCNFRRLGSAGSCKGTLEGKNMLLDLS